MRTGRIFTGPGWLLLALAAVPLLPAQTVVLKSGAQVQGEILQRSPERTVVDLGYTVLAVPGEQILRVEARPATPAAAGQAPREAEVYFETPPAGERSVRENVRRCAEAVVEVRSPVGLGSGFVIHPLGYVVTNHHVIAGEHRLSVTFFRQGEKDLRKQTYDRVRIVAFSPDLDLALLQIEPDPAAGAPAFPWLPLALSADLTQGQQVFAIGSPLGLERSVSAGIVSSRNRPLNGQIFIQTTTQINPGNSGGPLFDLSGRVVGVTNMKVTMAGVEGVGFAIPVDVLKTFISNRDAFAFDPRNPNAGFRYLSPPQKLPAGTSAATKGN